MLWYLSVVQCLPGQTSCTDGGVCQCQSLQLTLGSGRKELIFHSAVLISGQVRNACGILAAKKSGLKKFRK